MLRWNINEIISSFYNVKVFFKVDFLNNTPCSNNVVSLSVNLNGALKSGSDISIIFDKI